VNARFLMFVRDVRLAWRTLVRRKGFFLLVVAVLGTGMGSAVAGFAIFDNMQLRALPFTDPDRLVHIAMAHDGRPLEAESVYRQDVLTYADRRDLFAGVAAFTTGTANLSNDGRPERVDAGFVSPDGFRLLGLRPAMGRLFTPDDGAPGAAAAVLMSDELWRTRYAARPDIVGQTIRVNRRVATVVGVMPPGFAFPHRQRLWLPLTDVSRGDVGDTSRVVAFGRLAPGTSMETVSSALRAHFEDARHRQPERYQGYSLRLQPLSWYFVDWQARASQRLLLLAVLAVLVVAVANAAGLMLSHAAHREPEWALRTALGAPPGERLRATLASGVIVSAGSLALSLVFARAALTWLEGELLQSEDPMPYFLRLAFTHTTVAFAVAAAAGAAAIIGTGPGLRTGAGRPGTRLGASARAAGSRGAARVSGGLVAAQLALSLTVVVTLSIMVQSVAAMGRRPVGAVTAGVLTARVALPDDGMATSRERALFWTRLVEHLRRDPRILDATVGSAVPGFMGSHEALRVEGAESGRDLLRAATGAVDQRFFDTYGTRLLAGRAFTSQDDEASIGVAVVDRRFAEMAWPGREPLGRRLRVEATGTDWLVVVGVTENLHLAQVDDPPAGAVLVPLGQHPTRFATVAVRVQGDPYAALPVVRSAVEALDPDVPLYWVRSLDDAIRFGYYNVRIFVRVLGWLGLAALLVSAAGLYGLIARRIVHRTREIGIRRALGASTFAVTRTVLRDAVTPLGAGLAVGLALSWPLARAVVALEPGILSAGADTYGLATGVLLVAAALALAGPTARALVINPTEALRAE
jgi:putative ABC transport system permease protein